MGEAPVSGRKTCGPLPLGAVWGPAGGTTAQIHDPRQRKWRYSRQNAENKSYNLLVFGLCLAASRASADGYNLGVPTEPAAASPVAAALAAMPLADAVRFIFDRADSPWLILALSGGVAPSDAGMYWVLLPGGAEVWPVRVLVVARDGERHGVWLTYSWPRGGDHVVVTQPGEPALNPQQAGESGRAMMLAGNHRIGDVKP